MSLSLVLNPEDEKIFEGPFNMESIGSMVAAEIIGNDPCEDEDETGHDPLDKFAMQEKNKSV